MALIMDIYHGWMEIFNIFNMIPAHDLNNVDRRYPIEEAWK